MTPPGTRTQGRSCIDSQCDHHRGQAFVACCDAERAAPGGQRTDQTAEYGRRVVAIRQAVEHRVGALRTAIAGIGAIARERNRARLFEFVRRGFHQQADFPVAGVIAQCDGGAVGGADSAVRRENQELFAAERRGIPAHAGVLAQAEEIAGGRSRSISAVSGREPVGPGARDRYIE